MECRNLETGDIPREMARSVTRPRRSIYMFIVRSPVSKNSTFSGSRVGICARDGMDPTYTGDGLDGHCE